MGKDVATALAYSNPRDALAKHVDEEDKNTVAIRDGIRGNPNATIINESGMYSLIFGSRLAEAKKFKRWVTSEVLPALRKTGAYSVGESSTSDRADTLAALAKSLAEVRRLHEAGLVRAETAAGMAMSVFELMGTPVQDASLAVDKSELAASVRAFFRARVAFRAGCHAVSTRDLYRAWREWSGTQNVPRRAFTGKVRRLYPALARKQIRVGENGYPQWHFCGIALRHLPETKMEIKIQLEETK